MKKGLILEGGAMRGLFTAGVLDVLMENGVTFDGAVGVSAGAAFGCNIKSHQIGRVLRYNTRFCADKRYCGMSSLLKTGNIYSTEFCYGEVPLKYDPFDFETYKKDPMEFYVVSTDVETGRPVYHKYMGEEDSGFDWIRASASMPLASRIVELDGKKLLDGGVADSIPVMAFRKMGFKKDLVILTRPEGYRKKQNPMLPLIRRAYREYPEFVETAASRHLVYNRELDEISRLEREGEILVIRPSRRIKISRTERRPERIEQMYRLGREDAMKAFSGIKAFMGAS